MCQEEIKNGYYLEKFYRHTASESLFEKLNAAYPGTDIDPSFAEWFERCQQARDSAIVRYTNNKLDSFFAIKADAEKIIFNDGYLKWMPRFKIRCLICDNVSVLSSFLVAYCYCMQLLQNEFKQSYITVYPNNKVYFILKKHYNFREIGIVPTGERLLLRDNCDALPTLRADKELYRREILPVIQEAINDALCSYYDANHIRIRKHIAKYRGD